MTRSWFHDLFGTQTSSPNRHHLMLLSLLLRNDRVASRQWPELHVHVGALQQPPALKAIDARLRATIFLRRVFSGSPSPSPFLHSKSTFSQSRSPQILLLINFLLNNRLLLVSLLPTKELLLVLLRWPGESTSWRRR